MEVKIYGIYDPNNPDIIRYVGKTKKDMRVRLREHIYLSKKEIKRPINLWIKKLLDNGITPEIVELEKTNDTEWCDREIYWVSYYRKENNLLNLSDGGGSNLNYSPSEETRKKISEGNKGKIGYWRGKKMTEEHKLKIRIGGLGKKRSEETKKNISNSLLGKKLSESHIKKLSESHKGILPGNRRPVIKICLTTNLELEEYESLEVAAKENNIKHKGNIVLVCKGKRNKCGGFKWKYKN